MGHFVRNHSEHPLHHCDSQSEVLWKHFALSSQKMWAFDQGDIVFYSLHSRQRPLESGLALGLESGLALDPIMRLLGDCWSLRNCQRSVVIELI